jgi:hypothetical protein
MSYQLKDSLAFTTRKGRKEKDGNKEERDAESVKIIAPTQS